MFQNVQWGKDADVKIQRHHRIEGLHEATRQTIPSRLKDAELY